MNWQTFKFVILIGLIILGSLSLAMTDLFLQTMLSKGVCILIVINHIDFES